MAWIQRLPRKDGTASYKVYWRDPARRVRTQTFRKRKDADQFLHSVEHKKDVGTYIDPGLGKVSLASFWEYFIRASAPPAASTQALYRMQARKYILPRLGSASLNSITKPTVRTFIADLQEAGVGPVVRSTDQVSSPMVHTCASCSSAVIPGSRNVSVPDPRWVPRRPGTVNAMTC